MTARFQTQGLLRDTTQLSLGQGGRLLIQAAYFVLVARALGPDRYGAFITAVAMAALLGPFSGLGAPNLFIKNVRAGRRDARVCWGNGILLSVLSGTALSGLAIGLSLLLRLKVPVPVMLLVSVADLVLLKVTELAASGFIALQQVKQTALQSVAVSGLRLAGILLLMAASHSLSLQRWAAVYLFTSLLGTAYAVVTGSFCWGAPRTYLAALRKDVAEGVFFSIAGSAATIYNDIDKIMLSRLGSLEATGVYAAAYRVIDVSMTPVRSLAAAAYPEFFVRGQAGADATYRYARSLITKTSVYGVVMAAGLWFLAPLLLPLLGSSYSAVVPGVRLLALIPLLRCVHSFMADALSGAGRQRTRTGVQVVIALVNIGANLVILPRYSWRGAAWTSLGCDALLVISFWSLAAFYGRRGMPRTEQRVSA